MKLTRNQGLRAETQKILPLVHEGSRIDAVYRIDVLVDDCVIVELKCVEKFLPVNEAQLITYLKLSGLRLGLLMNFNTRLLKEGSGELRSEPVVFVVSFVVQNLYDRCR